MCDACAAGKPSWDKEHTRINKECKSFVPKTKVTNVDSSAEVMSGAGFEVAGSSLFAQAKEASAGRRPVRTEFNCHAEDDDGNSSAASERDDHLAAFAVEPALAPAQAPAARPKRRRELAQAPAQATRSKKRAKRRAEPAAAEAEPAEEPPLALRRARREPAAVSTGSRLEDDEDAFVSVALLDPETVASRGGAEAVEEEETPSPTDSSLSVTSSRRSSRAGAGKLVETKLEKRMKEPQKWTGGFAEFCPWGCGTDLVLVATIDPGTGWATFDRRDGPTLVKHCRACPKVLDLDETLDELRALGVNVGRGSKRAGAGSKPRRPKNHHLQKKDWTADTKRHKKSSAKDYRFSNDYKRERTLGHQDRIGLAHGNGVSRTM
jgi:hypothetical protein